MMWDDLTEEQRQAAARAAARVQHSSRQCFCRSCMMAYEAIAKAVVEALPSPATQTVPWEPRDGWPTVKQVEAWTGDGRSWRCSGGPAQMSVDGPFIRAATLDGVIHSQIWVLGLRAVVPFREGRPVSWSEVDAAVEAVTVINNNGKVTHG